MRIDFNNLKINELNPQNEFEHQVVFFLQEWFSESKEVEVQTSGSTGRPKVFSVSKEKMLNSAKKTCDFLELHPQNTALVCLPVEYISGKMMLVRSILRGLEAWIENPSLQPLQNLDQTVDFCAMTPLQVKYSLDKIHWIKNIIIGGAAVSNSLKKKIKEHLEQSHHEYTTKVYETYGMSETLSHIALKEIYPTDSSQFQLFDGITISLDDRGCLVINTPELSDEPIVTNDLVEIDSSSKAFRYIGRVDHVINSGGAKIFPEEVEFFVKHYIDREVLFLGVPDEVLGSRLIAVVEGEKSIEIENTILNLNYKKSFQKPKQIVFVNQIPRTPNGKVQRLELTKIIQNDFNPSQN